jgi:hypothetical protein
LPFAPHEAEVEQPEPPGAADAPVDVDALLEHRLGPLEVADHHGR